MVLVLVQLHPKNFGNINPIGDDAAAASPASAATQEPVPSSKGNDTDVADTMVEDLEADDLVAAMMQEMDGDDML